MKNDSQKYCFCIPTYKRHQLLMGLLVELENQSVHPDILVIIDGEPASGIVLHSLNTSPIRSIYKKIVYIPSNHANLPYQRYLGWKIARQYSCTFLVYLDDDLKPLLPHAVLNLLKPLQTRDSDVVGVTANIVFSSSRKNGEDSSFIQLFGDSRRYKPGSITPSGNRIPVIFEGSDYVPVDYLSGGAMALLTEAVTDDVFSRDLFAMYEKRIGKGEDTILSLRFKESRSFLFAFNSMFFHAENPAVAYPTHGFKKGYAIAYSRRMINDNYRGMWPPLLKDRLALYKSYFGNILVNIFMLFMMPDKFHFLFALGYLQGVLHGMCCKPSAIASSLNINWDRDSHNALSQQIIVQ